MSPPAVLWTDRFTGRPQKGAANGRRRRGGTTIAPSQQSPPGPARLVRRGTERRRDLANLRLWTRQVRLRITHHGVIIIIVVIIIVSSSSSSIGAEFILILLTGATAGIEQGEQWQ